MELLSALGRELDAALGTEHRVTPPLAVLPAWGDGRRLDPAPVLDALLARADAEDAPESARWSLAVTGAELHAPEAGRVFGVAAVGGGCAVVGLGALHGKRDLDSATLLERAVKEATHELGHAAGLEHCVNEGCVMHPSLHIAEVDRKARGFCAPCGERLRERNP